jgi:DNA-binding NarL/FixJ family response regulator
VLVLDDNPLVRHFLESRAQHRGDLSLETFSKPEQLLSHLANAPADLIVCDAEIQADGAPTAEISAFLAEVVACGCAVMLVVDAPARAELPDGVVCYPRPYALDEIAAVARHCARLRRVTTTRPRLLVTRSSRPTGTGSSG